MNIYNVIKHGHFTNTLRSGYDEILMVSHVQKKSQPSFGKLRNAPLPGSSLPPFLEDRSGVAKHRELETNKHTVKQLVDLENIEILIEKGG